MLEEGDRDAEESGNLFFIPEASRFYFLRLMLLHSIQSKCK